MEYTHQFLDDCKSILWICFLLHLPDTIKWAAVALRFKGDAWEWKITDLGFFIFVGKAEKQTFFPKSDEDASFKAVQTRTPNEMSVQMQM